MVTSYTESISYPTYSISSYYRNDLVEVLNKIIFTNIPLCMVTHGFMSFCESILSYCGNEMLYFPSFTANSVFSSTFEGIVVFTNSYCYMNSEILHYYTNSL